MIEPVLMYGPTVLDEILKYLKNANPFKLS